ncbi:MAG: UDP-N-acetylglucosamine pyrophosphorylase [Clostridia bacterium]
MNTPGSMENPTVSECDAALDALTVGALFDLTHTLCAPLLSSVRDPWEALGLLKAFILALGKKLPRDEYEQVGEDVWIARDAHVYDAAYIAGPTIIGHASEVRPGAFIRGAALVGEGAVVGNSTELKNCILFDKVQVPHFNYVGDSILGYKAHLGAGAVTSNVRSDKKNVVIHAGDQKIATGLRKLGALVGDKSEVGCNSVLNPGAVLGRDVIVYPTSCVRGLVPARSIYKNDGAIVARDMED